MGQIMQHNSKQVRIAAPLSTCWHLQIPLSFQLLVTAFVRILWNLQHWRARCKEEMLFVAYQVTTAAHNFQKVLSASCKSDGMY